MNGADRISFLTKLVHCIDTNTASTIDASCDKTATEGRDSVHEVA